MLRLSSILMLLCVSGVAGQVPAPAAPAPVPPPVIPMAPLPPAGSVDRIAPLDQRYVDEARSYVDLARVNERVDQAMREVDLMPSMNLAFGGPVAWARQDPADSLYRQARDLLNRGDYRKAADLFRSLPAKFPGSAYVGDAEYWQAFSLYRIGGTPELQQALAVLEARKPDTNDHSPSATTSTVVVDRQAARASAQAERAAAQADRASAQMANRAARGDGRVAVSVDVAPRMSVNTNYVTSWGGSHVDAAGLAARIASVLSSRGLAGDPAVKRALAAGGNTCDPDDQSVRAEALNALMQSDPATGHQMALKILANRDSCSVPLRRNAVMLVGNQRDEAAVTALIPVAQADPSQSVRMEAMEFLMQTSSPAATNAVIDLARTSTDPEVRRGAVEALAQSSSPRARAEIRAIIDSGSADESLRAIAIDGFAGDRLTTDDATWLRGAYARSSSTRVKEQILEVLSRGGAAANTEWVAGIVRDENQPLQLRSEALNLAGRNMDVAALAHMYDGAAERPIREELIELLGERKEPAALDKIVDIAKNGTDPAMRREAISVLARSKDPRASTLLLQLVDGK